MMACEFYNDELNSSQLGTLEHWEEAYETEIINFDETGDEGEIWFGEKTAQRMVECLTCVFKDKEEPVIDIGCGNGMLSIDMWKAGFENILGVDYSVNAIRLAKSIACAKEAKVKFQVASILNWSEPVRYFSVALDKGTYDAISLDPTDVVEKREKYKDNVYRLLKPGGMFMLASCNWTETELLNYFTPLFKHVTTLPSPSFTFGGKSGSQITTILFEKGQ